MNDRLNTPFWNKVYIVYYAALVVVFFLAMQPFSKIHSSVRILTFALTFVPILFRMRFFLPVFFFFFTVSSYSFVPIMPTQWGYYLVLVSVALFLSKRKRINVTLLLVPFYFMIADIFHYNMPEWFMWVIVVGLTSCLYKDERDINQMVLAFMLVSIFLSLLYLVNFNAFEWIKRTSDNAQYETSGWMNHNRFDSALCCGFLLSVAVLMQQFEGLNKIPYKVLAIATIGITTDVLLKDLSRGAILSLVVGIFVLFVLSDAKRNLKLIVLTVAVAVLLVLWRMSYLDFLFSKFAEKNVMTAGNRSVIWGEKFDEFFLNADFLDLIFGIGWKECRKLGMGMSTHNDWITAFIAFGVVGIFIYISFYLVLFYKSGFRNAVSLSILAFLLCESMVLEPFFRGNAQMIMFYLFALEYSIYYERNSYIRNNSPTRTFGYPGEIVRLDSREE